MSRIILEQAVQDLKFDFRKSNEDDLTCYFTMQRDGEKLDVIAKCVKPLEFTIVDSNGRKDTMNERDFALKFSLDYDDFKKELEKYTKEEEEEAIDDSNEDSTEIKTFEAQLNDDTEKDPNIKMSHTISVGPSNFIFNMLEDPAVEHYCECLFSSEDEETGESTYFKALLDIREKNSIVIKIIQMNEDGEIEGTIDKTELENAYPKVAEALKKAIKKMEFVVYNN